MGIVFACCIYLRVKNFTITPYTSSHGRIKPSEKPPMHHCWGRAVMAVEIRQARKRFFRIEAASKDSGMTKLNTWRCCIPDPAGDGDCTACSNPYTVNRSVALSWRLGNDEESSAIDILLTDTDVHQFRTMTWWLLSALTGSLLGN